MEIEIKRVQYAHYYSAEANPKQPPLPIWKTQEELKSVLTEAFLIDQRDLKSLRGHLDQVVCDKHQLMAENDSLKAHLAHIQQVRRNTVVVMNWWEWFCDLSEQIMIIVYFIFQSIKALHQVADVSNWGLPITATVNSLPAPEP